MYFIFVFKQKTAYEMRISDWSSDVCSSDLERLHEHAREFDEARIARRDELRRRARLEPGAAIGDLAGDHRAPHPKRAHDLGLVEHRLLSGIGQRHRAVHLDRTSVREGKGGSVRVDRGGSRSNKKKKKT